MKSVYGSSTEATKSADAPVQVVSALNYLFVFRQSPSGKILVKTDDERLAREAIDRVYGAIGPLAPFAVA